jgi:hypothetical protein
MQSTKTATKTTSKTTLKRILLSSDLNFFLINTNNFFGNGVQAIHNITKKNKFRIKVYPNSPLIKGKSENPNIPKKYSLNPSNPPTLGLK